MMHVLILSGTRYVMHGGELRIYYTRLFDNNKGSMK